ncbi:unnamed protein product, partial [Amoebophrya sp. A120]
DLEDLQAFREEVAEIEEGDGEAQKMLSISQLFGNTSSLPPQNQNSTGQHRKSKSKQEADKQASQVPKSRILEMLLDFLEFDCSSEDLGSFSYDLQFLALLLRYVDVLVKNSAIIPQICRRDRRGDEYVFVRWVPALINSDTKDVHQALVDACPRALVKFSPGVSSAAEKLLGVSTTDRLLTAREQVTSLVSLIVKRTLLARATNIMGSSHAFGAKDHDQLQWYAARHLATASWAQKHALKDKARVVPLVFEFQEPTNMYGNAKAANYFEMKEIPMSIHVWLSRLFFTDKDYRLRLLVKQKPRPFTGRAGAAQRNTTPAAGTTSMSPGIATDSKQQLEIEDTFALAVEVELLKEEKKVYALGKYLTLDHPRTMDVVATLNLLSDRIPGFEKAISKLGGKSYEKTQTIRLSQERERELAQLARTDPDLAAAMRSSLEDQAKEALLKKTDIADEDDGSIANRPEFDLLNFHYSQLGDIFLHVFPLLESLGVKIILPKKLKKREKPRLRMRVADNDGSTTTAADAGASSRTPGFATMSDNLSFNWTVAIGDKDVSIEEFEKMVEKQNGLVKFNDQFLMIDPAEMKQLFQRAKQVQKDKKKLSNFEVAQAALGCPHVLGKDVECLVDDKVAQLVQQKLSFDGHGADARSVRFPLYARPVVEKCILKVGEELEGKIYPELLEVACLHDGQTFDAEREMNGIQRSEHQTPVVKLLVSTSNKRQHFAKLKFGAPTEKKASAQQEEAAAPAGRAATSSQYYNSVGSLQSTLKAGGSGQPGLMHRTLSDTGTSSLLLNVCFKDMWRHGSVQESEKYVDNPFTRGPISKRHPPRLNAKVQGFIDALQLLLTGRGQSAPAGVPQGLGGLFPGGAPQVKELETARELPTSFEKFSDDELSEVFHRLKVAARPVLAAQEVNVLFRELKEIVTAAAENPAVKLAGQDYESCEEQSSSEQFSSGDVNKPVCDQEASSPKEAFPVPPDLCANLREYQKRGFQWLCHNIDFGFGCILADDMGLGKTVQVLTAILHFRNAIAGFPMQMPQAGGPFVAGGGPNTAAPAVPATQVFPGLSQKGQPFRVLVVCPTSLVDNWCAEAAKFTPSLRVIQYHGGQRAAALQKLLGHKVDESSSKTAGKKASMKTAKGKSKAMKALPPPADASTMSGAAAPLGSPSSSAAGDTTTSNADNQAQPGATASTQTSQLAEQQLPEVIVTSLGTARSDAAQLSKIDWFLLVLDEAQAIKNPSSQQTKALKSIPARHYLAMSGTPVENRLLEYWSIFDFVNKGYLGDTAGSFAKTYARPIEKDGCRETLQQFHRVTQPFLLRRLKTDKQIIKDLPDKVYCDEKCGLSKEQASLYQALVEHCMGNIEGKSKRKQGAQSDAEVLVGHVAAAAEDHAARAEQAGPARKRRKMGSSSAAG